MLSRSFDTKRVTKDDLIRQLERHEAEYGPSDQTSWQGEVLKVEWFDRLRAKLNCDIDRIRSAQVIARAIIQGRKMGKALTIAERIKSNREQFNQELDAIALKVDGFEAKKPDVLAMAHNSVDSMHAEVDGMDTELRQISNI